MREVTESSSSVSSGKVTRTDPPAGTKADRGATVRMFVSSGAPQVEVPEVRGQTQADAQATLSGEGLTSSVITAVDDGERRQGHRPVAGRRPAGLTRQQRRAHRRDRELVEHHDDHRRVRTVTELALAPWYERAGRHDLPWRATRDRWAVLVSEVMLQQTQVARVLDAWPAFMAQFPDVATRPPPPGRAR